MAEGADLKSLSQAGNSLDITRDEPELKRLAGYSIVREIGRGGMGIVYEAQHEGLGRRAALKVLARRLSGDAHAVERFRREGRSIARMHHSNIVPVFEFDEEDGRFFLAMQLISGKSLDLIIAEMKRDAGSREPKNFAPSSTTHPSLLASSTRSFNKPDSTSGSVGSTSRTGRDKFFLGVATVGVQAAEALAYAHERGIVHRDVKPSNLILDESGVTWLTDFGLAKSDNDDLTNTGDFVGTLRYMAPERFQGKSDERSDIYGLGLTLYELLASRPAFDSSDRVQMINRINNEEPTRLRQINPRIPRDLETIVTKAIDKEPKARYRTAKALAEDLRRYFNDLPIKARRQSWIERVIRWGRRNKKVAATSLLAMVALIALAIVSSVSAVNEKALRLESDLRGEQLKKRTVQLQDKSDQLLYKTNELQRSLYYAQMNLGSEAATKVGGAETVRARLQATHPDVIGTDFRGWEWYYLLSLVSQEQYVSKPQIGTTWIVDFSPDGTRRSDSGLRH